MRRSAAGQETVSGWIDGRGGQGGRALSVRGGAARAQVRGVRVEVACLLALLAGAGGAWAQTSGQGTAQPTGQGTTQPAGQAPATAGSGSSDVLQEVVVTAERRTENVQNVPISVSAFTSDELQSRNLLSVQALGDLSPGVNLDAGAPFSGDRSVLSASIRGVGQDDFAFNMNPAVGVYLDGVYLARTIGANQDLLDVDRVEILKGPQGTLFGANTEGGAISIITHTPGDEEKVTAQVTTGSFDRRDLGFTADMPLIKDVLLSSITVSSQERNGWVNVVPYPSDTPMGSEPYVVDSQTSYPKAGYQTADNYGGYGTQTVRGKLLWEASDKTTVTLAADWNHEDQTALPYTVMGTFAGDLGTSTFSTLYNLCISNGNGSGTGPGSLAALQQAIAANGGPPTFIGANAAFAAYCSRPRAQVPGLSSGGAPLIGAGYVGGPAGPYNYATYQAWVAGGSVGADPYLGSQSPRLYWDNATAGVGQNIDQTYATGPDFARNDYFGFSVTGNHQLNDDMSLKSISAYRQILWEIGTDLDGSPETIQEVSDHQHQWQVSQEFQLNGKALDDALDYVGGLYYFEEAGFVHDYVPFESLLYVYDFSNDVNNKNEAAFVHADYKLNNWGFTAGGRYTDVEAEFIGGQGDLNGFDPGCQPGVVPGCVAAPSAYPLLPIPANYTGYLEPGYPVHYFPPGDNEQSWHVFDPTLGTQYHFTDDVMAYLSWGKGFKAGGWTTRLSAVVPAADVQQTEYSPEYTKTWELGLKSEWFQHRLQANAALYYTDYDAIQLNIQRGISPVYTNAGNAKIKGGELELHFLAGGGLSLNASAEYIDAYYTYVNQNANIPEVILPNGDTECPAGPPICTDAMPGVLSTDAKLPKTPKYKFSFYPTYDLLLPNQATMRFIVNYTLTASMYNDSLNTPQLWDPATHMIDASVHLISPGGEYDLAVGGTNLTDDRFITAGSPNNGAGEVGGYYNDPREWYLQLTAKFK